MTGIVDPSFGTAPDTVAVSCPSCHLPQQVWAGEYSVSYCDSCGTCFTVRSFPAPEGREWATSPGDAAGLCGRRVDPLDKFGVVCRLKVGHTGSCAGDPSFATAGEALKAARDEHADELAQHVPPKYVKQSRLRHWWESKKGEWRMALRAWLGIDDLQRDVGADSRAQALDEVAYRQVTEALITKLRKDFDDATQANVDIFRNYNHRIKLTEQNVETLRGQFHTSSGQHSRMLAAFRTVPMNGVAWRKFCENERISNDRKLKEQKKIAGAIAPAVDVFPLGKSPNEGMTVIDEVSQLPSDEQLRAAIVGAGSPEPVQAPEVPHSD